MSKPKFRISEIKPWQRTLYIMFIAQFMVAVGFSIIYPFLPFFVEELGTKTTLSIEVLAGLVFSSQSVTLMISAPIWGILADRFGRKLMVERAMFGGGIIILLMAFAQTAEQVVLLRAIQGLFTGTVAAANALVAGEAPRRHTGYSMGLLQVGFGAGLAIGPLIGGYIADVYGYDSAFYITGGMLISAGVLVIFGVKENFEPLGSVALLHLGFVGKWKDILKTKGVPITFGMRFLSSLARMMVFPIIPFFIKMLGVNPEKLNSFTGLLMGTASAATTMSAIYFGKLGDKIGHRIILIACSFTAGLLYIFQALVQSGWQLMIFQVLVGIVVGGVIPTVSALLANFTQHGDEGAVYGMDNSINAAGRAVAPLLGAWVATIFGFRAAFPATGIIFLIAVVAGVLLLPKTNSNLVEHRTVY